MVERGTTTFLFVFFFLMLGVLVVSVVYNYHLLQSFPDVAAWLRSSESEEVVEVAQAQQPDVLPVSLAEETNLSLPADTVPYPVVRLSRDPASVFAPLPES